MKHRKGERRHKDKMLKAKKEEVSKAETRQNRRKEEKRLKGKM